MWLIYSLFNQALHWKVQATVYSATFFFLLTVQLMFELIHSSLLCFDRWTLMMETVLPFTTRLKESTMYTRQFITWFPVRGFFCLNLHSDSDVGNLNHFCCQWRTWWRLKQPHCVFVTTDVPHISHAPVLMMRPRAWNMIEHNMMVQTRSKKKNYQHSVYL